jgi:hypothetical protein
VSYMFPMPVIVSAYRVRIVDSFCCSCRDGRPGVSARRR